MVNKVFRGIMCLFCAISVLAVGWTILPERREPIFQAEREARKQAEAFQGMISLWQVTGWRTGGTSAAGLITQVLTELENRNPGVYFVLETLTTKEAQLRLAQGEKPDILSFPGGMTLPMDIEWQNLNHPDLLPCYSDYLGEKFPFLPWIASDAIIMIRNTSLAACKAEVSQTTWSMEELCSLAGQLTYQTQGRNAQRIYGVTSGEARWPELSLFGVADTAQLPGDFSEREAWNQLVEGNVSMLVAGPWEEMTLAWRTEENRGPDLTIMPWPADVPVPRSVQWIGCAESGDEKKDTLCREVAVRLTSEPLQKKVVDEAKCLAVIPLDEYSRKTSNGQAVLYTLPGRTMMIREKWSVNCSWGPNLGVCLWKP